MNVKTFEKSDNYKLIYERIKEETVLVLPLSKLKVINGVGWLDDNWWSNGSYSFKYEGKTYWRVCLENKNNNIQYNGVFSIYNNKIIGVVFKDIVTEGKSDFYLASYLEKITKRFNIKTLTEKLKELYLILKNDIEIILLEKIELSTTSIEKALKIIKQIFNSAKQKLESSLKLFFTLIKQDIELDELYLFIKLNKEGISELEKVIENIFNKDSYVFVEKKNPYYSYINPYSKVIPYIRPTFILDLSQLQTIKNFYKQLLKIFKTKQAHDILEITSDFIFIFNSFFYRIYKHDTGQGISKWFTVKKDFHIATTEVIEKIKDEEKLKEELFKLSKNYMKKILNTIKMPILYLKIRPIVFKHKNFKLIIIEEIQSTFIGDLSKFLDNSDSQNFVIPDLKSFINDLIHELKLVIKKELKKIISQLVKNCDTLLIIRRPIPKSQQFLYEDLKIYQITSNFQKSDINTFMQLLLSEDKISSGSSYYQYAYAINYQNLLKYKQELSIKNRRIIISEFHLLYSARKILKKFENFLTTKIKGENYELSIEPIGVSNDFQLTIRFKCIFRNIKIKKEDLIKVINQIDWDIFNRGYDITITDYESATSTWIDFDLVYDLKEIMKNYNMKVEKEEQ